MGYKPAGLTAEKVYSFDPYEDLDGEAQKHILGVQANMWTEYLRNENEIYPFLLPRLQAAGRFFQKVNLVKYCSEPGVRS